MKSQCEHQCAKLCSALEEAIKREAENLEAYRRVVSECDLPEVQLYFRRLVVEREATLASLSRKIDELRLGNAVTDQLNSSYA